MGSGTVRRLVQALQRGVPAARTPGCTVLAYHLIDAGTASVVDLPVEVFADQLAELTAAAEVLPLGEAVEGVRQTTHSTRQPRPLVAITFDDAFANFFDTTLPMLAERGFVPTLFVPAGFLEGDSPPPLRGAEGLPPASWEALAQAVGDGRLHVGSHSWSHPDLRRLPPDALERELGASRQVLEDRLGVSVDSFCYPRGLWSPTVERQVARYYRLAVIGGGRRWTPRQSPLRIQRVSLRRDGPRSLAPLLAAPVCLEEWAADRVRRLRR
ncbi:MAG TPA: polysaccharide deacetylase family protein [Thermoanaerobaculia bacterium]|nr:polysaccharide deacetylase family protein [Thermoanaerobaculia bacterium]